MADNWISPTGAAGTGWSYPARAYDGNTTTYAYANITANFSGGWSNNLTFTFDAINSDKIRVYSYRSSTNILTIRVEARLNETWTTIHYGSFSTATWVEYEFGGIYEVDSFRVAYYHSRNGETYTAGVREAEINQILPSIPVTFNGATISKWNDAEISKWNGVE